MCIKVVCLSDRFEDPGRMTRLFRDVNTSVLLELNASSGNWDRSLGEYDFILVLTDVFLETGDNKFSGDLIAADLNGSTGDLVDTVYNIFYHFVCYLGVSLNLRSGGGSMMLNYGKSANVVCDIWKNVAVATPLFVTCLFDCDESL